MWKGLVSAAAVAALAVTGVKAASYDDIPDIEVYGQHFFYTNNGSQFYLKGVAYQQNYSPNGSTSVNTTYTDPLADGDACRRDIPYLKQLFTNVIRVYAIDPTKNHDDCMAQLASADIYVISDMGEPGTSIESNNPEWDVTLYQRYTGVIDALSKYKNVIGFFAGNENVSSDNQTAAAAFVKAAVRDSKTYIQAQNYRNTLGVGYATADVPSRDELAHYFACEPGNAGNKTSIDFWGYNVYSWCGKSNYATSSYGERVDFFSKYPVPVFFAEYGCIEGLADGPTSRPFTEVSVLYGNMTSVFSGGIVYEWFMGANNYGLVSLSNNDASVSPYPDFTSLSSQLAKVSPSTTQRSAYTPTNSPPACPSVGGTWAAQASPLPPNVNPQLCACMVDSLQCTYTSNDQDAYQADFNYICGANTKYCNGIARNATTGSFGAYSGCNPKDQLAFVANQYYLGQGKRQDACAFSGRASVQSAKTQGVCAGLLSAAGTGGEGSVPAATGKGTAGVSGGNGGSGGGAKSSSSKAGAPGGGVGAGAFFAHGDVVMVGYGVLALGSAFGMVLL
ncbi:carbohydrate-binding module family 43 [Pyrenophora seminiperda CCB06]|uniref:1,3-beta-glucanosyltransferase n=1 Tax=Pyrenophora seminiperda CCB06 TaxID=1302712 RepID=A0A3M7MDH7_9PLEO|nr:carbohydrate-binding module family 43 [Pyrenophora seminiperda CCB06]